MRHYLLMALAENFYVITHYGSVSVDRRIPLPSGRRGLLSIIPRLPSRELIKPLL